MLVALQREAIDRSARDGLFWLQFVKTRDEADTEHSVKLFPRHLSYVQRLWRLLDVEPRTVIAKSRQMLVSWVVCAYAVWWARFKPNQLVLIQTQKEDDANKLVSLPGAGKDGGYGGRCQFIETNLPPWMQQHCRFGDGRISYPNGSLIEALAGGANQVRGKTASLIVLDEMAFLTEAKATYTAVAPLIQKGTKFIGVSTPNGAEGNFFYHLWHGLPMGDRQDTR